MNRTDESGKGAVRRWYQPRPQPSRRGDLMGINSMWWMTLLWIVVIALAIWPFPVW